MNASYDDELLQRQPALQELFILRMLEDFAGMGILKNHGFKKKIKNDRYNK